jgi:hypothetical protein
MMKASVEVLIVQTYVGTREGDLDLDEAQRSEGDHLSTPGPARSRRRR